MTVQGTVINGVIVLDAAQPLPEGTRVEVVVAGPLAEPSETVEERFRRLEATWMAAVGHFSSPNVLRGHPAFQEIIGLGRAVVPFMLRDLEERPRLWVLALPEITGANPVPTAEGGKIRKMTEAWLRWGKENGYR